MGDYFAEKRLERNALSSAILPIRLPTASGILKVTELIDQISRESRGRHKRRQNLCTDDDLHAAIT
jgi:hypothetical protein